MKTIGSRTAGVRKNIQAAIAEKGVDPGRTFRDFPQNIRDIAGGEGIPPIIDVEALPTTGVKKTFYHVLPEESLYAYLDGKWVRIAGKPNDYTSIKRVAQYLYDVTYDQTVTEAEAEEYLSNNYKGGAGQCTSLAGDGFAVHQLDWYLTHLAEFHIHTPRSEGRLLESHSMGGNSPELTDEAVASGRYSPKYKWLPFTVSDGINEAGVFASVNVVSSIDGERTTGTNPGLPRMHAMRVVRHILDNYKTADEAVQTLANKFDIYAPQGAVNEEFHWIIADGKQKFILECVGNKAVIIDKTEYSRIWMTNFRLSGVEFDENGYVIPETVEPHGQGVERYNLVNDYREAKVTLKNLVSLGSELRFSRAYTEGLKTDPELPLRKTDFCGIYSDGTEDLTVTTPDENFRRVWGVARERWSDTEKRDKGLVWQSEHLAIYEIASRTLTLCIQEDFDKTYTFQLGGQSEDEDSTTLVYNLVASEEQYEYSVVDDIQPELNAQIVANGTAKFFKFVPPMSGAKRLMKAASKASGEDNAVTVNRYVLAPIMMCNTRHSTLSLAAQIFEEDMTITGVVEYRDGVFYRGEVGAGDTFVSFTHDQYMTEEQQNLARKNMDVYHTDKKYRNVFAEYSGDPEKYEKVSSRGGRIYAFVQSETWMKEYAFEKIFLDGSDFVYWDYNRDCVCAKIKESGDIFRVCFALQDNAEANVSELEGDPIVFPKAGVWFFADDKPGNVSADTYREVIHRVPDRFLPEYAPREDLTSEVARAKTAEADLLKKIEEAGSAKVKVFTAGYIHPEGAAIIPNLTYDMLTAINEAVENGFAVRIDSTIEGLITEHYTPVRTSKGLDDGLITAVLAFSNAMCSYIQQEDGSVKVAYNNPGKDIEEVMKALDEERTRAQEEEAKIRQEGKVSIIYTDSKFPEGYEGVLKVPDVTTEKADEVIEAVESGRQVMLRTDSLESYFLVDYLSDTNLRFTILVDGYEVLYSRVGKTGSVDIIVRKIVNQ